MGNVFDIVLVAPFTPADPAVATGMAELGFTAAPGYRDKPDESVWLRLDLKLPFIDGQKVGLEGLCRAVAALPWERPRSRPPWRLQVLWKDDHTMEDDGWAGRSAPYQWQHETWDVTTKEAI